MLRESKGRLIPPRRELEVGTPTGVLRPAEVFAEEFIGALRS